MELLCFFAFYAPTPISLKILLTPVLTQQKDYTVNNKVLAICTCCKPRIAYKYLLANIYDYNNSTFAPNCIISSKKAG